MANVIVIVRDDRTRRQVEQLIGDLGMDDIRFASFKDDKEFQNLYFKERPPEPEPKPEAEPEAPPSTESAEPTPNDEQGAELKLFSEIHLVIYAFDSISSKSTPWINSTSANLKKFKYWPENSSTRIILLKFEDDGIEKLDILHPALDDLIYLPIDRLVFLQKMQIILTLPKRASPSFLFNQEVKMPIEISKITKVDRLSDVALAIRNPVALKKGLPGRFYLTMPGEKTKLEIRGRVLKSVPHPEQPGQYLVYFTYFALAKNALTQIRRALSKSPRYHSLIVDDREKFRFNPDDLFAAEQTPSQLSIAVIDSDDVAATALAQSLPKDMDNIRVGTETSMQIFMLKNFEKDADTDNTPPKASEESDFYGCPLSLSISKADLKCLSVDPGPADDSKIFGHLAKDIFADPDGWLKLLSGKESKLLMEEAAQLVSRGRVLQKILTLKSVDGIKHAINVKIYKGTSAELMTVELTPANLNDIMARMIESQKETNLDVIIADSNFAPDDPTSWIEGIRMRAVQVGLCKTIEQLKFFFITDNDSSPLTLSWLNMQSVMAAFVRPVDNRQLNFLLSEYLPNPNTAFNFDNLGWTSPSINVHVAKDVELEALSEFGATLKSKQKIFPGTIVYLRKSIFENAPNQCLAARVYACEENQSEKDTYQIYVTYFGINDAFLKYARTWIRENYASQKSQGEGG